MSRIVSNEQKNHFIHWFLKHFQLKQREGVWLLNYALTSEDLLKRIRFTNNLEYCPIGISMATVETRGLPFRMYHYAKMTNDADAAFAELKKESEQPIYIQLTFPNGLNSLPYQGVIEGNPYMEKKDLHQRDVQLATRIIDESLVNFEKQQLYKRIDEALDQGDEELFKKLVDRLNELK